MQPKSEGTGAENEVGKSRWLPWATPCYSSYPVAQFQLVVTVFFFVFPSLTPMLIQNESTFIKTSACRHKNLISNVRAWHNDLPTLSEIYKPAVARYQVIEAPAGRFQLISIETDNNIDLTNSWRTYKRSQSPGNEVDHGSHERELKLVTFLSHGRKAELSCFPL